MPVLRDGRLLSVLSCLGGAHEEVAGRKYVEATFGTADWPVRETFDSLADFKRFIDCA